MTAPAARRASTSNNIGDVSSIRRAGERADWEARKASWASVADGGEWPDEAELYPADASGQTTLFDSEAFRAAHERFLSPAPPDMRKRGYAAAPALVRACHSIAEIPGAPARWCEQAWHPHYRYVQHDPPDRVSTLALKVRRRALDYRAAQGDIPKPSWVFGASEMVIGEWALRAPVLLHGAGARLAPQLFMRDMMSDMAALTGGRPFPHMALLPNPATETIPVMWGAPAPGYRLTDLVEPSKRKRAPRDLYVAGGRARGAAIAREAAARNAGIVAAAAAGRNPAQIALDMNAPLKTVYRVLAAARAGK